MVPLVSLLPFLGAAAVKALVSGNSPDADAWGAFSEKLLGALLVEQAQTSQTLARIEAKLDQMEVQAYKTAMASGHDLLKQAQRDWRRPRDRERLLHVAQIEYVQAAAGAPDDVARSDAQVYLAMTWLLMGSVQDTKATLADAASTLNEFVENQQVQEWTDNFLWGPEWTDRIPVWGPWATKRRQRNWKNAGPEIDRGMEHLRPIQEARRLLGVARADTRMPGPLRPL